MNDHYVAGEWNAICDQCGRKYKASTLRKRWDGLMVCSEDYETRHPQEFVRSVRDNHPLPFARPEPTDAVHPDDVQVNCNTLYLRWHPSVIIDRTIIGKGVSKGPVLIEDGAEVIVLCEWTIE